MKRVLLIEDNDDNIALFTFLLEADGLHVTVARTGQEGVDLATTSEPDVILLDVQLPDMDGLEVLDRIRDDPQGTGLTVIAVTSFAMAGDRERLLEAGCLGYIEKPIDVTTFAAEVRRVLEASPG